MEFNTAMSLVKHMDQDKWNSRYAQNPMFIFEGCEGRFMRRKNWPDGKYITVSSIFGPKICKSPRDAVVVINMLSNTDATFSTEDKFENDWEVWDLIPNGKAIVDPTKGKFGLWSKYQHKFVKNNKTGEVEETKEFLPYWDKELQDFRIPGNN